MKTVSDNLYYLIKSLTYAEKKHFKRYLNYIGDKKNHLAKLFKAIEKQTFNDNGYDEVKLKEHLKKEKFTGRIPNVKNHLYNAILKSIYLHYAQKREYMRTGELTEITRILLDKGLFQQCVRLIKKGKQIADKYDLFTRKFELSIQEGNANKALLDLPEMESLAESLFKEQESLLEKAKNSLDYRKLAFKFEVLQNKDIMGGVRDEEHKKEIIELVDNPLFKDESLALSYFPKVFFYNILSIHYGNQRDNEKNLYYINKLAELVEKNIIKERGRNYNFIISQAGLLGVQVYQGDYDGFYKTLHKLKNIKDYVPNVVTDWDKELIFCFTAKEELMLNIKCGNLDDAHNIAVEIEKRSSRNKYKIHIPRRLPLFYSLAYFYFVISKFDKSLKWVNRILMDSGLTFANDIQCYSKVLSLILHFEMGNYNTIDYILQSTQRFLTKREKFYKFETIVLGFVRKLRKINNDAELFDLFCETKQQLSKISIDPMENDAFESLDLISWLDSKIEKKTFAEILKVKAGNSN